MDQYLGKRLGNYDIIELIGKGGMATVYRGHQPSMNRSVAVKVMSQQYSSEDQFVSRFENEARLIAQLEHANILPVYDFGEQEGVLYIVMRFLSGGTLGDLIREGGMPADDAAKLFTQLASALDYAHSRGVIHRDLKPGNIMFDEQGHTFLSDFGIAKSLEEETNLTGTGGVVGTPTYMSPEQGLGERLDARSDIYALGVILFEMLTGKPPFTGDNPMAVMLKHINEPPPRPSEFNSKITRAVEAVIMRALAKDPTERYDTAMQMADALDEALRTKNVPEAAAGFTTPEATLSLDSSDAVTLQGGQISGAAPATMSGGAGQVATMPGSPQAVAGVAAPVVQPPGVVPIAITLNAPSQWLKENAWLGQWAQALMLSAATFAMLLRLTQSALPEAAILSLVPGLILYGLLGAPTLGGIVAMVLILAPLAAHAPALALIWLILLIIMGSRFNSREIMLTLVTVVAAGTPIGWTLPLLLPWWMRPRRVVLPMAVGFVFATLFAITLGWPDGGGLLPVLPELVSGGSVATIGDFGTSYLGLLEPEVWSVWGTPDVVINSFTGTLTFLGEAFAATSGQTLVLATVWVLAAVLTVSNQRAQQPLLRAAGIPLALVFLLAGHLVNRNAVGLDPLATVTIMLGVFGAIVTVAVTQFPIQVDPNTGNLPGTVLRLFRQALGALFMALGVAYFSPYLIGAGSNLYSIFWVAGITGTLVMLTNPFLGPPLVFLGLAGALWPVNLTLVIVTLILLFGYLFVNLIFDRRRPRRWNPLGAGFILGAPGMATAGFLPLGPMSIGALEAQVPAAMLAGMGHVLMVATAEGGIEPIQVIVRVITTITGVLLVERLMQLPLLGNINHKLRRLIFSVGLAAVMAVIYFGVVPIETALGRAAAPLQGVVLSVLAAGALVLAMGERAALWREFFEAEQDEEEGLYEDEEVTGAQGRMAVRG